MLSERNIINGLILIGGMILGPYLIIMTFEYNQVALLTFACLVFLFLIFFVVKDRVMALPLLGAYFHGKLNFLPFGFTPLEVFNLVTIFYYIIHYVALKRKPLDIGPLYLTFPILIITVIVLYHDHDVGLHIFGSSEVGARPGLLILMAVAAYVCGINIPTPSITFISRLPWYCFGLTCLGSAPFILTSYFPGLAPYVYYVSGNINMDAYMESIGGDQDQVERAGGLLSVGGNLQSVIMCYYPISTWWRPQRWILPILSLLCLSGTLIGGYRSGLAGFVLTTVLATVCYSRWRLLFAVPLLVLIPLGLVLIQNDHPDGWELPVGMQRTLSFLPGKWDEQAERDADSSNKFRDEMVRVYMLEYFYKSPLVGNGFAIDPSKSEADNAMAEMPGIFDVGYFSIKGFIDSKNFHVGWISLYDAVGIIGSIAYLMLNFGMIWLSSRFVFGRNADMQSPLFPIKVWFFCALTGGILGYFFLFGSFSDAFVGMTGVAIIMVHLDRIERRDTVKTNAPFPRLPSGLPQRGLTGSLSSIN